MFQTLHNVLHVVQTHQMLLVYGLLHLARAIRQAYRGHQCIPAALAVIIAI